MTSIFAFGKIAASENEVAGIEAITRDGNVSVWSTWMSQGQIAYKCFAASSPRPVFAPVMTITCPVKSTRGTKVVCRICPTFMLKISVKVTISIKIPWSGLVGFAVCGALHVCVEQDGLMEHKADQQLLSPSHGLQRLLQR